MLWSVAISPKNSIWFYCGKEFALNWHHNTSLCTSLNNWMSQFTSISFIYNVSTLNYNKYNRIPPVLFTINIVQVFHKMTAPLNNYIAVGACSVCTLGFYCGLLSSYKVKAFQAIVHCWQFHQKTRYFL